MNQNLDALMKRFRVASRELFNNVFRMQQPDFNEGWDWIEQFKPVENELFKRLVLEVSSLARQDYGKLNSEILVEVSGSNVPAMVNRGTDSGYWDYPLRELSEEVKMSFIRFFDWDELDFHDNRHVRARIDAWPTHPEAVGKHVLFDPMYAKFSPRPLAK